MSVALHPLPHWSVPLRRQHAVLVQSGRVLVLFLAQLAILALIHLDRAADDSLVAGHVPLVIEGMAGLLYTAVGWALLVWPGESRSRRGYHHSLPVHSGRHDLLRVLAGATWLLASVTFYYIAGAALGAATRAIPVWEFPFRLWLNGYTLALTVYLAASVLPLLVDRALEWTLGATVAIGVPIGMVADANPGGPLAIIKWIFDSRYGMHTAMLGGMNGGRVETYRRLLGWRGWTPPAAEEYYIAAALWLGLAALAVLLATRRRRA